jgi:hypothetical protein
MEQNTGICRKPKYTMRWLGLQSLYVLGLAVVLALIANGIDGFASTRVDDGLLKVRAYNMLTQSIAYCFGVIAITLMSLVLVEIVFRKNISYLQYALIALALTLFYLLLLAMSEKMPCVLIAELLAFCCFFIFVYSVLSIIHFHGRHTINARQPTECQSIS